MAGSTATRRGWEKNLVLDHLRSSDPKLSNEGSHSQADGSPPNPTPEDFEHKFFKIYNTNSVLTGPRGKKKKRNLHDYNLWGNYKSDFFFIWQVNYKIKISVCSLP